MFCGECGTHNPDTNQFCKNCGKPLKKTQTAGMVPPHSPPQTSQLPVVATSAPIPVTKPPRDWLGIGSIFLGILAWLIIPYLLGCSAVILAIIAVYKRKKEKNTLSIAGIIGMAIAVIAILVNYLYIVIF